MGNRIGFEADSDLLRLTYIEDDPEHVSFVAGLNSKYIKEQIRWGNSTIFFI